MHKTLRYLIFGLLLLAGIKGAYHLLAQAWYFAGGAYAGDAKYYWTVGKAILNGFTLYTDTFDTKPPTIYLLSALSFGVTGSAALGNWLNAAMTLTLPALFGIATWKLTHKKLQTSIAVLFGGTLTLYLGYSAEPWQVEWYGSFFGLCYVLLLALYPNKKTPLHLTLLTLCMAASIGFKETFFLGLLAAAITLRPNLTTLKYQFGIPVIATAVVGIVALLVTGYAGGYFTTYLTSQFGHHIARSTPLPLRGIQLDLPALYLAQFSYLLLFTVVVLIVAVAFAYVQKEKTTPQKLLMGALPIVALYLVTLAGNMRGYPVNNHFAVMAPYLGALFFAWLQTARGVSAIGVPILTALTLLLLPMSDGFAVYAKTLDLQHQEDARDAVVAAQFDAILDACNIQRYFFVEERPYMHHMKHSPLNFFVYTGPESIVYHHPVLIDKQLESFSQATLVIAQGDTYEIRERAEEKLLSEMTFRYLANHFTITPPPCAEGVPVPEGYSVLHRKVGDTDPFPYQMKE